MNRQLRITLFALLAGVGLVAGVVAWAMTTQLIDWDVVSSGGGRSGAEGVVIADTVGQAIIGPAQADGVEIHGGHWAGADAVGPRPPTGTPTPTRVPHRRPSYRPLITQQRAG